MPAQSDLTPKMTAVEVNDLLDSADRSVPKEIDYQNTETHISVLEIPAGYAAGYGAQPGAGQLGEGEISSNGSGDRGMGVAGGRGIVVEDMIPLTGREEEILRLLAQGYSNQKIADKLYVSINTVKTHVSNLFEKLGASSRVDALLRARSAKLL